MRVARALAIVTSALGLASGIACGDLLHDTDFPTLCDEDPAACVVDAALDAWKPIDAGAPTASLCASSPAEAQARAAHACAWLGSCEGPLGESAFGACMTRALLAFDCRWNPTLRPQGKFADLWSCLAAAHTCGAVDACLFPDGLVECAATAGPVATCGRRGAKDILYTCGADGGVRAAGVEPCSMRGQTCGLVDGGATCIGPANDCHLPHGCAGDLAIDCVADLDHGVDCDSLGGRCVTDDAGTVCAPSGGETCAASARVACDGAIAMTCAGGTTIALDCQRLGAPCDVSFAAVDALDVVAACTSEGHIGACTQDRCDGTKLTGCGRGTPFSVDCASVGLRTCAKTSDAGNAPASCVP